MYKGNFILQVDMYDKWSKIEEVEVFLDGESIIFLYYMLFFEFLLGKYLLKVIVMDLVGNKIVVEWMFKIE